MNILFILFLPTSGWWPFARGPLGLTMWPLAASGGWPLARGQLHSDLVNARRMWPYMPGGRWRGGPYKRGTTVYVTKKLRKTRETLSSSVTSVGGVISIISWKK